MIKINNWDHKKKRSIWNLVNIIIFLKDSTAEALTLKAVYLAYS